MQMVKGAKANDALSATAASALARMLKAKPALAEAAVAQGLLHAARRCVSSSDHRLQVRPSRHTDAALSGCSMLSGMSACAAQWQWPLHTLLALRPCSCSVQPDLHGNVHYTLLRLRLQQHTAPSERIVVLVQTPGFNMVNTLLACAPATTHLGPLFSDTALVSRCLELLDDRRLLVAAKALLTLGLLTPRAPYLLLFASQKHLLTKFMCVGSTSAAGEGASEAEREAKEYAQQCQAVVRGALLAAGPQAMTTVCSSSQSLPVIGTSVLHFPCSC